MNKINVLISGSGSLYGTAVIQALLKSTLALKLVACDMNPWALGLHLAHLGYIVPPAQQEKRYLTELINIINKEGIHAIFVASSKELDFFSSYKAEIEEKTGAKVFTNSPEVLKICSDKWHTVSFLKEHGFYYPKSLRYPEDREQIGTFIKETEFPIIVKPRRGTGSQNIYIVNNFSKLRSLVTGKKDLLLQQYLPNDQGEFTTGICTGAEGRVLSGITLKRHLQDGMTMSAMSGDFTAITDYCKQVAQALKPYGPCNFQLRILNKMPYIFEINPRFSSTTGMRTLLGVNEAEILLRAEILGEEIPKEKILKCSVIRQYSDYVVPTEQILQLERDNYCINRPG
ncbi:ATP-grasp domain-containing protein [Desulfolucanica intricata]|uniref:ATP-grasp domain-containing protein n=1 Tax=Desulfolucanica intricata TaxID=1285191 RepID=UPI00082BFB4D|nr:ATP-grasp domain-containing protein [Desulfolucanica intricata]